ncbi:hypothetical protein BU24DRAFT_427063 [Aaosphaeria arxii CBS 175.79]|uniref:Uncharacterized protein n=1 Tax=Aaosphaeria arxii CBS 175.79 TaxID=1450172 RepID=A0A6A5XD63_9PLEO|nr:uncharacterized protein BU24DRAFT_427063 [Aaosphaeria arxii CBS 175.79]KAF2010859.1 hypothetical protein BU24DRAFT_427063 [Aaosphaeria arxii CBS 175.79]
MDPPSPSKNPMSPGMPVFPVSPERLAGTKPLYGAPSSPQSPALSSPLRMSPLRSSHRRNDSDVSVHGLAARFETLDVKDHKEAQQRFAQAIDKIKVKHLSEMRALEKQYQDRLCRQEQRIEQMVEAEKAAKEAVQNVVSKDDWDRQRKEYREAQKKWEGKANEVNDLRKLAERKAHEATHENKVLVNKVNHYKKKCVELSKEMIQATGQIPTLQADMQSLKKERRRLESDLKFHSAEAEKYKNQVYGLQVDLEGVEARLNEEIQTVKATLALVEAERDALKTSLKEEEVLRIAAEGQIPLPAATTDEHDEFGSPVRSPRKPRAFDRDEEDKENVAPKKNAVELKFLRQELAAEKRLRMRAEDQVDFMKMECQFQCCSCRIADLKGSKYVHDNALTADMELIKASLPAMTPPASDHGDEQMEDAGPEEELVEIARPNTPPTEGEDVQVDKTEESAISSVAATELPSDGTERTFDAIAYPVPPASDAVEPETAYSPTTGTFHVLAPQTQMPASMHIATPAKPSRLGQAPLIEDAPASSPFAPDASGTMIHHEDISSMQLKPEQMNEFENVVDLQSEQRASLQKHQEIQIHEDVIDDSDEEEDDEPQTPLHGPSAPATPAQYLTRTITTTTTIPIHFSPMTPAVQAPDKMMTPVTVAHAPTAAQAQVLGEITLNKLPFDREAALEAIRQRRGRARSMAAGQGTPMKKMLEGVKERRDISAPVSKIRR